MGSGVGDATATFYRIDEYAASPTADDIGSSGTILTDLAVDPLNDAFYGVSYTDLYSVNMNTGKATEIGVRHSGHEWEDLCRHRNVYAISGDRSDLYVNLRLGRQRPSSIRALVRLAIWLSNPMVSCT